MSIVDELDRIAGEAAQARRRLDELARACAELRAQLAGEADSTTPDSERETPRKLQSVS
jgi:uncharacterized membrane protein YccC